MWYEQVLYSIAEFLFEHSMLNDLSVGAQIYIYWLYIIYALLSN